jgi:aldehyde:ferredoxin oxidoreductase
MAPRVLHVDLGAIERGERPVPREHGCREPWAPGPWATLASWGGSALGLACLHEHAQRDARGPQPFVLAVGEAVRAGLPTAARAAVLSRAPLSGLYAEGHVGGELGARLARVADALVLEGRATPAGAVLVIEEDGRVVLLARPDLRGAAPAETVRALETELGSVAVLAIGPAGERGLPFASLASGHSPPSFVGRGGLGAAFGALGLKALCVRARPAAASAPRADSAELFARLRASPRLAARSAGGTLELFDAWAARGELAPDLAHGLAREARERADERHGCRGCPTPCGWVFERSDGAKQGARFGASHALGLALGLESLDDALHLLGLCDELGADAKEVGAVLALQCLAQERGRLAGRSARGERDELARRTAALVDDPDAPGRAGAAVLARSLGLEAELPISRGQTVRAEASRAVLLGQCVASGGADPMRSFPFLLESVSEARLAALLAPLPLPREALDARSTLGKGRLVFWHENLISAVDLTGFCAFSAAGLVSDGLADIDELAVWILPQALRSPADPRWAGRSSGARLLAAGANLVLARRELNRLYGMASDADRPAFAREVLDEPGMLDEYRALRGLDQVGAPSPPALAHFGTPGVLELGLASLSSPAEVARAAPAVARVLGRVTLRAGGELAQAIGERCELELALPASVQEILRAAAAEKPPARAQLLRAGEPVPAVWRAGRRLAAGDRVAAGDVLDLVTAISGG